ncbi:hypothetical protein GCM10010399_03040 [Dactylosporangium fulvum]|uniref:Uncharacterized protein n=1 Tax=Dactylosporangium fulvum TaxID=53359 RepID=A0ABY5VVP2_9ACTN|nr:hypothetical protein [Dactylosporangium fulvum]UWP79856.1 hypothetical protein Dfulv_32450 [Dactylosporangium fulvum]
MRKFLAIGHHGPVDPELGLRIADVAVDWISARLADGTFDCLYSMAGGGRMIVANADSEETLLAMLRAAPDAPREWTFTELFDGIEVIRKYVESMRSENT